MLIRKAKLGDIADVSKMAASLLKYHEKFDTYFTTVKNLTNLLQKYFIKYLKSSQKLILVLEDNGSIIGFASAEIKKSPNIYAIRKTGLIEYMFIEKKYRKKGIGKILLRELFNWFRKKRINYILISVHLKNVVAKKAWKKYGFTEFMSKQRIKI